jgi:hypothetical protein
MKSLDGGRNVKRLQGRSERDCRHDTLQRNLACIQLPKGELTKNRNMRDFYLQ